MKYLRTIFAVFLAVALFGISSCKNDEDDELKTVATFYGSSLMTMNEDGVDVDCIIQITATFYNNLEYKIHTEIAAKDTNNIAMQTLKIGTYTGDPTKNSTTVKMKTTKEYDIDTKKWKDASNTAEESFEISADGKVSITEDSFSMTIQRQ